MKYRPLGNTGIEVSEISLGTWQVGGKWGSDFDTTNAEKIINEAIDQGVNFIDTADVYSEGLSEKVVGEVVRKRSEKIYIATKAGRRLSPFKAEYFNAENLERFIDDSLSNMKLDTIDFIQLHCPPTEIYNDTNVFEALERIKEKGKIQHYGVSVEKVEEAIKSLEYPGIETIQIIVNMFRLKPVEEFFPRLKEKQAGIIVRVPLASGLLSGKFRKDTKFEKGDHRFFNRQGMFFDKGETFSGVNYQEGLEAVEELKSFFNVDTELAQIALRWVLMFDEVSCIIPGASNAAQVYSNIAAAELPPLNQTQMEKVKEIYDRYFRNKIHNQW